MILTLFIQHMLRESPSIIRYFMLAQMSRDAMAKAVYSELFRWLVDRINAQLLPPRQAPGGAKPCSIGLLDIFGFESFAVNSLEQLLINYCNEKLQSYFNKFIFEIECEVYRSEGVEVPIAPDRLSNEAEIRRLEGEPDTAVPGRLKQGLIDMIDYQANHKNGSDDELRNAIGARFPEGRDSIIQYPKVNDRVTDAKKCFYFQHYAGRVTYNLTDFVVKSNDKIRDNIREVLRKSTHQLVSNLFVVVPPPPPPPGKKKSNAPTIITTSLGAQFQRQLQDLLNLKIEPTEPHVIRCIIPTNAALKADDIYFDDDIVGEQLRYSGIVSVCIIRKEGFPYRCLHTDFVQRFQVCFPFSADVEDMVTSFAAEFSFPPSMIVKGRTMVLMKAVPHELLARLYEVADVLKSLSDATESNDEAFLLSEIDRSAQVLTANATKIGRGRTEQYEKVISRAKQRLLVVKMEKKLEATMKERQIATLQAVLKEAVAFVIPAGEESNLRSLIDKANSMVCLLLRQEEVKTKLKTALAEGNRGELLEWLKSCEKEGLDFAEMQHAHSVIGLLDTVAGGDPALLATEIEKCSQYGVLSPTLKIRADSRLTELNKAVGAMEDALTSSDISKITSTLSFARQLGLDESLDIIQRANTSILQFERQEAIRADLMKAVEKGDRGELEQLLATCHGEKMDFAEIKTASALLELLIAITDGDLDTLNAKELESANLGIISPEIHGKVEARRSRLDEEKRALDALLSATSKRDLAGLKASLQRVEELGLSANLEVVVKARDAMALLEKQNKTKSDIASAIAVGDKFHLLQHIATCDRENWEFPEKKQAKAMVKLLEAMNGNDASALIAAFSLCDSDGTVSPEIRSKVEARRSRLEEEKRALDALLSATSKRDLAGLKASLQRVEELGMSETLEAIVRARDAVALLDRKECVKLNLTRAMIAGDKVKLEEWIGINREEGWGLPEAEHANLVLALLVAMRDGDLVTLVHRHKECDAYCILSQDFREKVEARRSRLEEEKRAIDALVFATNKKDLAGLKAYLQRAEELGLSETLEAMVKARDEVAILDRKETVRSGLVLAISLGDKIKLEEWIGIDKEEGWALPEAKHAKGIVALLVAMSAEDLQAINEHYDQCDDWGVLTSEIKTRANSIRNRLSKRAEVITALVAAVDSGVLASLKMAISDAEEFGLDHSIPEFAAALLAYDELDILTALRSAMNNWSLTELRLSIERATRSGFTTESCPLLREALELRSRLLGQEKALEALEAALNSADFVQVKEALSQGDTAGLRSSGLYCRVRERLDAMELVKQTLTSISEDTVHHALLSAEAQSLSAWPSTMKLNERYEELKRESAQLKELKALLSHATVSDIDRLSHMIAVFNSDRFLIKHECTDDVRRAETCLRSLRKKAEEERTRRLRQTEIEREISKPSLSEDELLTLISELKDLDLSTDKACEALAKLQMGQMLHQELMTLLESDNHVGDRLASLKKTRDLMISGGYYLTKEYEEAVERATEVIGKEEKVKEVHDLLSAKTLPALRRGLEIARKYKLDSEEIKQAKIIDTKWDRISGYCILLTKEVDAVLAREKENSNKNASSSSNSTSDSPSTALNPWDMLDKLLRQAEEKVRPTLCLKHK